MQVNLSNINWKQIGLYLVILVSISMLFSKCKNESLQLATIKALKTENSQYRLKNKQLVTSSNALFATNKKHAIEIIGKTETVKQLTDKFTIVKSITKYVDKVRIDTVNVIYNDSVPCVFEKTGSVVNTEYSLNYKSNQKGIDISDLVLENDTVTIVNGIKKKWFWGKETLTIDIANSNKLVKLGELQHVEIQPKKRFYETTLFKVGVGVLAGTLLPL
jgi:hypothetical protein